MTDVSDEDTPPPSLPLKAPLGFATVCADDAPLSAAQVAATPKTTRRNVLLALGGGSALTISLEALGGFVDARTLIQDDPPLNAADHAARLIRQLFPHLAGHHDSVCLHPNGDNRLLKRLKNVGYPDATLADHLSLHDEPLQCIVDPPNVVQPSIAGPDLSIFSLTTLHQGYSFWWAARGLKFEKNALLNSSHTCVRRSFRGSEGPHVVVGSPTGNRLSAYLRGKARRTEPSRDRELVHEGVLGLHLPFEFSLDRDADHKIERADGSYAWAIRRLAPFGDVLEEFRPTSPSDPIGATDYFTISVIPNHFRDDMDSAHPVILLEGCSAIGTSGLELLWTGERHGPLNDLLERVESSGAKYWQAIFMVTGVAQRPNLCNAAEQETYAIDIQLKGFVKLTPRWRGLRLHRQHVAQAIDIGARALHQRRT